MKMNRGFQDQKIKSVQKRISEIKGFYKHLTVYLFLNILFTVLCYQFSITIKIIEGLKVSNNFSQINYKTYPLWILWGVFLCIHAYRVFGFRKFIGKDWEERKLQELMDNNYSNKKKS